MKCRMKCAIKACRCLCATSNLGHTRPGCVMERRSVRPFWFGRGLDRVVVRSPPNHHEASQRPRTDRELGMAPRDTAPARLHSPVRQHGARLPALGASRRPSAVFPVGIHRQTAVARGGSVDDQPGRYAGEHGVGEPESPRTNGVLTPRRGGTCRCERSAGRG